MVESEIFPRSRVTILGILNVTPDSFSDGGRFVEGDEVDVRAAVEAGLKLVEDGAHIVDVGGESTRPGAQDVPVEVETARVVPVIRELASATDVPISVDTRKSRVAEAALEAGARIVNDISGLGFDPGLAEVAARRDATLILGHLRGSPATMQKHIYFSDVLAEVAAEIDVSVRAARAAGVREERIAIDPGIGFGKDAGHNLALLCGGEWLRDRLGFPVVLGPSRKSFLRRVIDSPDPRRLQMPGWQKLQNDPVAALDIVTSVVCTIAAFRGADALRVHDPAGSKAAAAVGRALNEGFGEAPPA